MTDRGHYLKKSGQSVKTNQVQQISNTAICLKKKNQKAR